MPNQNESIAVSRLTSIRERGDLLKPVNTRINSSFFACLLKNLVQNSLRGYVEGVAAGLVDYDNMGRHLLAKPGGISFFLFRRAQGSKSQSGSGSGSGQVLRTKIKAGTGE